MAVIKAFLFDLDGVMVDTEPISRQAWNIILKDFDRELDEKIWQRIIGRRSDESARIIKASLDLAVDASDFLSRKKKAFSRLLSRKIPIMPGLRQMIEKLSNTGVVWAVATSSPRSYAQDMLSRIGLLEKCAVLAGGDEVTRGKPNPDIYLLAAKRLGVQPHSCLALEDSIAGCQAAVAAEMVTVAVPTGAERKNEFSFVNCIYDSLNEVADDLDYLIGKQNY